MSAAVVSARVRRICARVHISIMVFIVRFPLDVVQLSGTVCFN
jgi:hypothetical protein